MNKDLSSRTCRKDTPSGEESKADQQGFDSSGEKKFCAIAEELPLFFYYVDKDLRVRHGNRIFRDKYRIQIDEPSGVPLEEVIGSTALERGIKYIKKALRGETVRYHDRFDYITGESREVEGILVPDVSDNGDTCGYFAVITDVTQYIKLQRELENTVQWLETAVSAGRIGLWEWDIKSGEVFYSEEWKRQIGCSGKEIGNDFSQWSSRLHPDEIQGAIEKIENAIDSDASHYEAEFRLRHKNGSYIWIYSRAKIERDENGKASRLLGTHVDITAYRLAQEKLTHSHQLLDYIISHDRSAIAVHDRELRYIYVSRRYMEIYKIGEENIIGRHHYDVFPDLPQKWREVHRKALAGEILNAEDDPYPRDDGTVEWTRWECRPWYENDGSIGGIIVYTEVITDRKNSEAEKERLIEQLGQAQKMESIGRLAGGVAHDFNNMLGVILGRAELALSNTNPASPAHDDLLEIFKAAKRSAELTRQLLAFARKQAVKPVLLDLNSTISGMTKLLKRLIGENIELLWEPGENLCDIMIDPVQIDQILANLAVNARDAIDSTGKLFIRTKNMVFDSGYCEIHPGFTPGRYVLTEVADTGRGMTKDVYDRLFEPFFTTKKPGEGTGLGLSTVYGIVRQNNGFINVYSEPDRGTIFRIYLPAAENCRDCRAAAVSGIPVQRGNETILVAEDEESVRSLCLTILENYGYNVLAASTPDEALKLALEKGNRIKLLVTDIVMPVMDGKVLSEKIKTVVPGIRVLFMSGYTSDIISHHGIMEKGINFLHKPFSPADLAGKVREILDIPE